MRISIGLLALAASFWPALATGGPAQAEALDLRTVKCQAFFESNPDNIDRVLVWLNGFYKSEDDPAVIDFDEIKKSASELGAYCAQHPDASVSDAADELFEKSDR